MARQAHEDRLLEREIVPYEASTFEAKRVLVLAPHPDDEVFGCGAAVASLREKGAEVLVFIVSDGAGEEPDPRTRKAIEVRRVEESRRALGLLGGAQVRTGGFPDRGLWTVEEALAGVLSDLAAEFSPGLVFAPSPVEVHPDHRAVASVLVGLLRSGAGAGARALRASRIAFYEISQPIRPNFLLDATPFVSAKDDAMAAFGSQISGKPYPLLVRGLNAYRTMTLPSGSTAAEAYFVAPGATIGNLAPARLLAILGPSLPPGALETAERGGRLARLLGFGRS
jgi:LmbE family N-acetylglucosaminyl deacetylase